MAIVQTCKPDQEIHAWTHPHNPDPPHHPQPDAVCQCGQWTWQAWNERREQEKSPMRKLHDA